MIDIRTRYNNHERCQEVEALYKDKIGHSGFSKVWKGETWSSIMPEVYTPENKLFHRYNVGSKGSKNPKAKFTEQDIINIRTRKKNGERIDEVKKDYSYLGIRDITFENIWYGISWQHIVVE